MLPVVRCGGSAAAPNHKTSPPLPGGERGQRVRGTPQHEPMERKLLYPQGTR